MSFRWVLFFVSLSFVLSGCLVEVTRVHLPGRTFVDEPVVLSIDARLEGETAGVVGIVLQLPDSCTVGDAVVVGGPGQKILRRSAAIEDLVTAERGHRIVAYLDSLPRSPQSRDTVTFLLPLRFSSPGRVHVKYMIGEVQGAGKKARWTLLDPRMPADFSRLRDSAHILSVLVRDATKGAQNALAFSGERQYVVLPDSVSEALRSDSGWTVEAWIKSDARSVPVLSCRGSDFVSPFPLDLWIDERGRARSRWCNGNQMVDLTSLAPVADGSWHHLAVGTDRAGGQFRLLVDGADVAVSDLQATPDQGIAAPIQASGLLLGTTPMRRVFFRGLIDEVRIWGKSRTKEDIQRVQFSVLVGDEPGLVAYYPIDENGGQEERLLNRAVGSVLSATPMNQPRVVFISTPTRSISLSLFARVDSNRVLLQWTSKGKDPTPVFEVIRRGESGKYERVTRIESGDGEGDRQTYVDTWNGRSVVYYRLKRINRDGSIDLSEEVPVGLEVRHNFLLGEIQPQPISGKVEIPFLLKESAHVTLTIYDALGREVTVLISGRMTAGRHRTHFDGTELPDGLYFCKMKTSRGAQTRTVVLSRASGPHQTD